MQTSYTIQNMLVYHSWPAKHVLTYYEKVGSVLGQQHNKEKGKRWHPKLAKFGSTHSAPSISRLWLNYLLDVCAWITPSMLKFKPVSYLGYIDMCYLILIVDFVDFFLHYRGCSMQIPVSISQTSQISTRNSQFCQFSPILLLIKIVEPSETHYTLFY